MKTTFNNRQLAHVWAQHNMEPDSPTPENGKGHQFYYEGATIYSYGSHFPIARFVERKGKRAVLFTTRNYSVTTSKHMGYARQAIPAGVPVFHIVLPKYPYESPKARKILGDYKDHIAELQLKADRSRTRKAFYLQKVMEKLQEATAYAEFFGLKWNIPAPADLAGKLAAAQKAEAKARALEEKKRKAAALENLEKWRKGEEFLGCGDLHLLPVALRIIGEEIETSKGARIPVEHAKRIVWPAWRRCIESGQGYKRNGHTLHVGHFAIDEITPAGILKAGCHTISREELERMEALLGLTPIGVSA